MSEPDDRTVEAILALHTLTMHDSYRVAATARLLKEIVPLALQWKEGELARLASPPEPEEAFDLTMCLATAFAGGAGAVVRPIVVAGAEKKMAAIIARQFETQLLRFFLHEAVSVTEEPETKS